MKLLDDIDLPRRFSTCVPPIVTQMAVSAACLLTILVLRIELDVVVPGAAPFALIFPAVMMSTLLAGMRSGLVTAVIGIVWGWYFVLPSRPLVNVETANLANLVVVIVVCLLTLAVTFVIREAVVRAQADRDQQIADRDLFLHEFDHRVRNNFAIVISLLDMQRRRADPSTAAALATALARVEGISRAHHHLDRGDAKQRDMVEMASYLNGLCMALRDALSPAHGIEIQCHCDAARLSRDRAVSIGLIVNELVTNAAKHAFPDRDTGHIEISFTTLAEGWRLIVADDGVGLRATRPSGEWQSGLGTKLVDAFARQAGGTVTVDSTKRGTRVTLDLAA